MTPTLHIIGCGRAARALARLWHRQGVLHIGRVMNRSLDSARAAIDFIGAGEAVTRPDDGMAGAWLLLGLPDGELEAFAAGLADRIAGRPELVFHLSGSVAANVLAPLACPVAAVHPVRAFANPEDAARNFAGTWCVGEGDEAALGKVLAVFETIGARTARLESRDKRLYHAATVAASNFLVALHQLARDLATQSGLPADSAVPMLIDLQRDTLRNLEAADPVAALTGPIERGDVAACRNLLDAVAQLAPEHQDLFRAQARAVVQLARRKSPGDPVWEDLEELLNG